MQPISCTRSRAEKLLIRLKAAGIAFFCTLAAAHPARADVTLAIGTAPSIGSHRSLDGNVSYGGRPQPLVDLDATFGATEVHAQSVPYVRTQYYGNPFDPSSSAIQAYDATFRIYERNRRLAFGIGYGVYASETYRTEPPGTLSLQANGMRLELHAKIPTSPRGRLELTFGGMPDLHGSLENELGIEGAAAVRDSVSGSQLDASAREIIDSGKAISFAYGIRYVNATLMFAKSNALVERSAELLPFAELRLRL